MIHLVMPLIVFVLGAAYEGVPMDDIVRGTTTSPSISMPGRADQPGNLFFSPGSISTALAMTYAGASGETADQMAKALHFTLPQEQLHPAFAALSQAWMARRLEGGISADVANRLWGQQGYHFQPDSWRSPATTTGPNWPRSISPATEQARQTINAWVEEQTNDKIKDLIPPGVLDALTRLVLTNAIYFKGDWAEPFQKGATQDDPVPRHRRQDARTSR